MQDKLVDVDLSWWMYVMLVDARQVGGDSDLRVRMHRHAMHLGICIRWVCIGIAMHLSL